MPSCSRSRPLRRPVPARRLSATLLTTALLTTATVLAACSSAVPDQGEARSLMNEAMREVRDSLVATGTTPAAADEVIGRFTDCVYERIRDDDEQLEALASADDSERIDVIQRNTADCQQIINDAVTSGGQ